MARPKSDENKPLTDTEIQIMNVLWDIGEASVHEVLETMNGTLGKDYAYTTVSTLLRVLEKKGAVTSKKVGRGHIYSTAIEQSNYQKKATDHLVKNVFLGQPAALIRNLLGSDELTKDELNEVKRVLSEWNKK